MEALFILIAEMIILPMTLLAALVTEAVIAALSLVVAALETVFGITLEISFLKRKPQATLTPEIREARQLQSARRLRLFKRISFVLLGLFGVLISFVLVLNTFFFETTVRWALGKVEQRTGIDVRFESASGSFFTGRFVLNQVTAVRTNNPVSNFDFRADQFLLDLNALRILPFSPRLEEVLITGLEGEFHRLATPDKLEVRKPYQVEHLRIESAEVVIYDHTRGEPLQFRIVVHELDSRPLRSQFAIFDLLFRSNVAGEIEGRRFAIRTERTPESGRKTAWEASSLPVTFVGQYFGGPFKWMNAGTVDIRVRDEWRRNQGEGARIDMHWSFVLKDISVESPTNAMLASRLIEHAAREYLRRNNEQLDISFGLTVEENQFKGTASLGAAGLWDAVRHGFNSEIAKRTGGTPEQVDGEIRTRVDQFKRYLDRRRAGGSNESKAP